MNRSPPFQAIGCYRGPARHATDCTRIPKGDGQKVSPWPSDAATAPEAAFRPQRASPHVRGSPLIPPDIPMRQVPHVSFSLHAFLTLEPGAVRGARAPTAQAKLGSLRAGAAALCARDKAHRLQGKPGQAAGSLRSGGRW